jgi:hypothetical protein
MMDALDQAVDIPTRQTIMETCGRRCIGTSILDKARQLAKTARDMDDMLAQLNQAHLGGGHLRREGAMIHALYDHCYCGSVNKSTEPFSPTYCYCSCGWYRQLFETLLERPSRLNCLAPLSRGRKLPLFDPYPGDTRGIKVKHEIGITRPPYLIEDWPGKYDVFSWLEYVITVSNPSF